MIQILIILLIIGYITVLALVYIIYKQCYKRKPITHIKYVPLLDKELVLENETLKSLNRSLEVRYDRLKQTSEDQLKQISKLTKDIDTIFKLQNNYKG